MNHVTDTRAEDQDNNVIWALGRDIGYNALHRFFTINLYASSDDERGPKEVCAKRRNACGKDATPLPASQPTSK
jgi:hypothetical protein